MGGMSSARVPLNGVYGEAARVKFPGGKIKALEGGKGA